VRCCVDRLTWIEWMGSAAGEGERGSTEGLGDSIAGDDDNAEDGPCVGSGDGALAVRLPPAVRSAAVPSNTATRPIGLRTSTIPDARHQVKFRRLVKQPNRASHAKHSQFLSEVASR
jgi:hypothetical protein